MVAQPTSFTCCHFASGELEVVQLILCAYSTVKYTTHIVSKMLVLVKFCRLPIPLSTISCLTKGEKRLDNAFNSS